MAFSPNQRGALFMALAMFAFTTNDTIVKYLSETMAMGQIVFMRNTIASVAIFLIAQQNHALRPIRYAFNRWIGLRIVGEVGGTITFLIGLAHIPIATATAILQALPLAVTMAAALFLKEPVGWRRWSAIAVGFIGVVIIVRPGVEGFSPYALLLIITILFATLRDLATRKIGSDLPPLFISSVTAPAVALSGLVLTPPLSGEWVWLAPVDWVLILATASLVIVAYHFVILTMREGDISFIAPFRYAGFPWAILLGFVIFGDRPDRYMILGGCLIVASGLYTLYRERIREDVKEIAAEAPSRHTP